MESLRTAFVCDLNAAFFLPRKIIIDKGISYLLIHLRGRRVLKFLSRKNLRKFRFRGIDAAVMQIPEGRVDMMPVTYESHNGHSEKLA